MFARRLEVVRAPAGAKVRVEHPRLDDVVEITLQLLQIDHHLLPAASVLLPSSSVRVLRTVDGLDLVSPFLVMLGLQVDDFFKLFEQTRTFLPRLDFFGLSNGFEVDYQSRIARRDFDEFLRTADALDDEAEVLFGLQDPALHGDGDVQLEADLAVVVKGLDLRLGRVDDHALHVFRLVEKLDRVDENFVLLREKRVVKE